MHTYKLNKILNFKVMGLSGNDQTACLVAGHAQCAAEEHSRDPHTRRRLTKKRKESIRTTNNEKIQKPTCSECSENFIAARARLIRNLAIRTN